MAVVRIRPGAVGDAEGPGPGPLVRLLAALMLLLAPAALALETAGALTRLQGYGVPAAALVLYRGLVAGLGMAVAPSLWAGRPGAVTGARWWLGLDALGAVLTALTPFFPSNRLPDAKQLGLALSLAVNGAWFVYLRRSRRVRVVWPEAGRRLL